MHIYIVLNLKESWKRCVCRGRLVLSCCCCCCFWWGWWWWGVGWGGGSGGRGGGGSGAVNKPGRFGYCTRSDVQNKSDIALKIFVIQPTHFSMRYVVAELNTLLLNTQKYLRIASVCATISPFQIS